MVRFATKVLGWVFLVIGVVGVLTPIPFGIFFLMLSMLLLIPTTPGMARFVQRMRSKSPHLDRSMAAVIRRAPAPYRRILRQTDIDFLNRPT